MKWVKSKIGDNFSNTAIMAENYHIAKYITYINGEKVERYLLSDCSDRFKHQAVKWFDDSDSAKSYAESLTNIK